MSAFSYYGHKGTVSDPKAFYSEENYVICRGAMDQQQVTDQEIERGQYELYAPALKKGDIFFWGSRVIHGSIAGTNNNLRRRSIAAHFVPEGMKAGNLETEFQLIYKKEKGLTYNFQDLDRQRTRRFGRRFVDYWF